MTQETVTVRAEQRFQDWDYREVRTVPRDRFIDQLIENGRVTVVEDAALSAEQGLSIGFAQEHRPFAATLPDGTEIESSDTDRVQQLANEAAEQDAEDHDAGGAALADDLSSPPPARRRRGKA